MAYLKEHEEHDSFSSSIFYMNNYLGEIQIEECDICGYQDVICLHIKNTWNDQNTKLTCLLCEVDGT